MRIAKKKHSRRSINKLDIAIFGLIIRTLFETSKLLEKYIISNIDRNS